MQFWIVGTDTDVGKTTVSAWICLHTRYFYWKPIQTGCSAQAECVDTDSTKIKELSRVDVHPETHILKEPAAPYLAARMENIKISFSDIKIPKYKNLLIESAGGLMVPINENDMYIDIIKKTELPAILVARSSLGTINHTCLSIEALRKRKIDLMGIIISGETNLDNMYAIEKYGKTEILAQLNLMHTVSHKSLYAQKLPQKLINILK